MRIISLNTWGGRAMQPLMEFFRDYRDYADIFCLQEMHDTTEEYRVRQHPEEFVRWDVLAQTKRKLHGFGHHFARFSDNPDRMSVANFWRPGLNVAFAGNHEVYRPSRPVERGSAVISPRKLAYLTLPYGGKSVLVVNYHGLWTPDGKGDSRARDEEIGNLLSFLSERDGPVILCADLNLAPGTRSLEMLQRWGLRNLVAECGIRSTRTPLYRHYNELGYTQYADYIMVTSDVRVRDFRVWERPLVSDHAILSLDFTV